jgi:hypothetical protein
LKSGGLGFGDGFRGMGGKRKTSTATYLRNPLVDQVDHAAGLSVVGAVQVVVVDVELGIRVGGAGSAERDANEVLTEDTRENAVAEASILVEDLIDNVIVEDLALVAGHDGLDVVLNDLGEGVAVVDVLHPLRELRVPQESVATDQLAVGSGPVNNAVSVAEAEAATARCR